MVVVKIKRDEQGRIITTPVNAESSEPPESPPPERPESPESPKLPSAAGFEFNELNRAIEVARWYKDTIIPLLRMVGFDDDMILAFTAAFASRLSTLALRKYQMSVSSISLAKAIEIIDEELPKLIKQANEPIDVEGILKAWNVLKELAKRMGGEMNG